VDFVLAYSFLAHNLQATPQNKQYRKTTYKRTKKMKFGPLFASAMGCALLAVSSASPQANCRWRLQRKLVVDSSSEDVSNSEDGDGDTGDKGDWYFGRIYSDETDESACIEVKHNKARNGQKLILGDCEADGNGWRGDSDGLIHSELGNGDYCMQAGHGGPVKANEYVRLYKCDPTNKLQKFVFVNGGGIRPKSNMDLCIVWRGAKPHIGTDPLFFKKCDQFSDRNDWSNDPFPGSDDDDDRSACVDANVPEFLIDDDENIGDTLLHPGPGFAASCGRDCYIVKDSGDDPPFDPELGDTLRFAYKAVTSTTFSIQSLICGVDCDGGDGSSYPSFGRTGLMIRESLDPLASNVFVSHSPNGQADWSYRVVEGGDTILGFDGSPDVTCLWINLARNENVFSAWYAYEGRTECDRESEFIEHLNMTFAVEMPETVYVGLAVSTGVSPSYCTYTQAYFQHIECRGCELE
jgi:Ricin-type beta-trefoil lectin domain